MRRLFGTFPTGAPGCGLVVLRVVAALSLQADAAGHVILTQHASVPGVALILLSLALLVGLLTPIFALLAAAIEAFLFFTGASAGIALLLQGPLICLALALLGPGAYSVDARLFGSRVVILHASDQPRD
ncbi:MAG TPA: hypothetical protein VFO35_17540 [Steroidobacteraceae bacterium]|nr:hypothetical protein [Steroidobacteraceae bacterium]